MASLDTLKQALLDKATTATASSSPGRPLTDAEYSHGFEILASAHGWARYHASVTPHLSELLTPLFDSRLRISVLEIAPDPKTILGSLPFPLKRKITRYNALVPNGLLAASLQECFSTADSPGPLPCLERPPAISRIAFGEAPDFRTCTDSDGDATTTTTTTTVDSNKKFDLILLYNHGLYGPTPNPNPDRALLQRALELLVEPNGLLVVLHREGLSLDGLVARRTVVLPSDGVFRATAAEWRNVCRALGGSSRRKEDRALVFRAPGMVLASFTRQAATALGELTAKVPPLLRRTEKPPPVVKNAEARLRCPAAIVRPTETWQMQECVRWALRHGVGLTVVGGGHSGHCLWPHVVAVDMGGWQGALLVKLGDEGEGGEGGEEEGGSGLRAHAFAASTTGDLVRTAMRSKLAVPLGARPSVGAGSWLQGGIGHLARLHGLSCDAVVGVKVVSLASGEIRSVGSLPGACQSVETDAESPSDSDLLWALKGAGPNFGILTDVGFKTYPAPTYLIRKWLVPLGDGIEVRRRLRDVGKLVVLELPRNCSADVCLYCHGDRLRLGVTMLETSTDKRSVETTSTASASMSAILGPQTSCTTVDGVGVFDTEMYVSEMQHGGGKTSSFKRSLFLKHLGEVDNNIADVLVAAIEARPTPLCYLHLAQGGGAVGDVSADATAFGCRDWDFACTIAGVWPRSQERLEIAQTTVDWVYKVAEELLPLSSGAYSADLGPDPRDAALAARAFGSNLSRLARLKREADPRNVLRYACPLPKAPMEPKLIVLVTGESGAGKDYCADVWACILTKQGFKARAVSISEATKREYAAATGADVGRLLRDRAYKEQHRPSLAAFWESQVQQRPRLPEEHFLNVVYAATDVTVLFITGMRDEAPVTAFSHLVPDSRLLDVRVQISEGASRTSQTDGTSGPIGGDSKESSATPAPAVDSDYRPSLVFHNDTAGDDAPIAFANKHLLPFLDSDLQRLADMVRSIPDFPRPGIEFRHVLDIAQHPSGLSLCTHLLERHFFSGHCHDVDKVVCCEAGGFVFAAALAPSLGASLVLIREAGKLPPPTVSVDISPSHISAASAASGSRPRKRAIEMDRDAVPWDASVLVVDDVLATGRTLCAVLRLLGEAGVAAENVSVMVVAEFPVHHGRVLLRRSGFGGVSVQSLLVFGGA
ncbi:hypothetical protein N658DRAFT_443870 [Parathielavia hyrcaniae]|uniref:FAD-binding PCMH-type domain-containing protein n=1 Tax=Parathielavia hyrcaniae TaxID=113614 RepID=A0AAN6Q5Q4_9PEZI|nr:hypothetical protein N658DRAFT_443870 [Parathielavia hyrcaniae]